MDQIISLLSQSRSARLLENWSQLESISIQILQILYRGASVSENHLKDIVRDYLSSIIGTGDFLTLLGSDSRFEYLEGLQKLELFLAENNTTIQS